MTTHQTESRSSDKPVQVLYNGVSAGLLQKMGKQYRFAYFEEYLTAGNRPVSITMPLRKEPYESNRLFPVFANLLSEGVNKKMQCRMLRIDEQDYFGLLVATAKEDSIGPLTIKDMNEPA
jgi:serine/threonine-protein kinase HipA